MAKTVLKKRNQVIELLTGKELDWSEKSIALMNVYRLGYDVFGDRKKFDKWVISPNRSLDNRIPLEVMDTVIGIEEVKSVIGRIQHGVYF